MKNTLQQWFLMLTTREKVLVVGGIGFTVIMLLWGMVYEPMKKQKMQLNKDISESTNELRWMYASSEKIKQAKNKPKTNSRIIKGTPSSIINQQLKRFSLAKGSKMSGMKQIDLRLRAVQADALMKFFGVLEMRYAIHILSLEITPKNTVGSVDVNVKLGRR